MLCSNLTICIRRFCSLYSLVVLPYCIDNTTHILYTTFEQSNTLGETQHLPVARSPCKTHILLSSTVDTTLSVSTRGGYNGVGHFSTKSGKLDSAVNDGTTAESAEVNTPFGDAEDSAPDSSTSPTPNTSTYPNTPSNHTPSAGSVMPLLVANTMVIDVNDKKKGRYGKMLEKRYCFLCKFVICYVGVAIAIPISHFTHLTTPRTAQGAAADPAGRELQRVPSGAAGEG